MNCTHIEKLLPLYVEGDLDAERAETVLTHLDACRQCQARAAEYEESQNWLRSYSPPEFDETFFDGLRQSVQSEIARAQRRPNFFQLIVERWGWQPVMAAAMALLVIVSGLALYARFNRVPVNQKPDGEMIAEKPDSRPTPVPQNEAEKPEGSKSERAAQPQPQHKLVNAALPTPLITNAMEVALPAAIAKVMPLEAVMDFQAEVAASRNTAAALEKVLARYSRPQADLESTTSEPAASLNTDPAPETMRIEMQTTNPNIRIIWLAPKETGVQPTKTHRDTQ